ncbi:MAG: acyltransferase [Glaciihabitans sp.]|nr:acyltransferase [Glaciihabitans sp.]
MAHPPAQPSTERLPSLDGLRGLAAFVVLLYHLSLVARPFLDSGTRYDAWWWLTETPLKLFTAGTESVLVFFVLSGLVVTLPALRTGFRWRSFYASRLVRLYLPVWGALALGAILIAALPRDSGMVSAAQWISNANATAVSAPELLGEASLWQPTYIINNVLWSLRWELIFSITLPAFIGVVYLLRRWVIASVVVAALLSVAGRVANVDALVYLPVFFLGTTLAVHLPSIRARSSRVREPGWAWVTAGSLLLLVLSFLLRFAAPAGTTLSAVLWGLAATGATGLILVAIGSSVVSRLLSAAVSQWLGRISFSLYLVHVPVLASVSYLVGDNRWWLVAIICVPLCVTVGWLFYRIVERPSHRLARRVGRLFGERRSSVPVPTAE